MRRAGRVSSIPDEQRSFQAGSVFCARLSAVALAVVLVLLPICPPSSAIGSSGVGKSLGSQYISARFSTSYRATIGADFIMSTLPHATHGGEPVVLQIWDTAGQEGLVSGVPREGARERGVAAPAADVSAIETRWRSSYLACFCESSLFYVLTILLYFISALTMDVGAAFLPNFAWGAIPQVFNIMPLMITVRVRFARVVAERQQAASSSNMSTPLIFKPGPSEYSGSAASSHRTKEYGRTTEYGAKEETYAARPTSEDGGGAGASECSYAPTGSGRVDAEGGGGCISTPRGNAQI
ncbi:hypothetical protein FB451DRAFT_1550911 [Mycena latifolia]|nr:hypothetical protein FB451DRAFT_1550911 [Mycena latifolia]